MKSIRLLLVLLVSAWSTLVNATVATPCSANSLSASYDVIIVGGGLGGSVAARRLAEANPSWKILVVERGIPYEACSACQSSSTTGLIYTTFESGGYLVTAPQTHINNAQLPFKDPTVLGGGSSVNGETHIRGDAHRYFPKYFPANWNWQIMQNFYKKYENYTIPPGFNGGAPFNYAANVRGNQGPVEIDQQPLRPYTIKYLNAMKQVYPSMPVYYNRSLNNGQTPGIGSSPADLTTKGNVRVSAYTAYIRTYTGTNLKVITNTFVNKVVFAGTAVSGVNITFFVGNATQPTTSSCVVSTNQVIMSAGTIATPKILKLSGVGPAAELKKFGIPVVSDLAGVGANFDDHFVLFTNWAGYNDAIPNNNFPDHPMNAFYNAEDAGPDAENNFAYDFAKTTVPGVVSLPSSRTNANSRGSITLASADPRVSPIVDPNYMGNEADKYAAGLATLNYRKVAQLMGLTAISDPCTNKSCNTPMDVFNAYVSAGAYSVGYHWTATAKLCNVTNPVSLRVKGTTGLYVLDASMIPRSPAANTQSTVYAVSEYGAQLININMHLDGVGKLASEVLGWLFCAI